MADELLVQRTDGRALGELRLLDANGRVVATEPGRSNTVRLPLGHRAGGLYLLHSAAGTVKVALVR